MSYCTPAQLIRGPGALLELAQLYEVDAALLRATIAQADRSDWLAEEIALADEALAQINDLLTQADGEVDARLSRRGYTLPMDPAQFPVLTVWARSIARYHANRERDKTSEELGRVERDYRDAIRALDQIAAGNLTLGAGDPTVPPPASAAGPDFVAPDRVFDRASLSDY